MAPLACKYCKFRTNLALRDACRSQTAITPNDLSILYIGVHDKRLRTNCAVATHTHDAILIILATDEADKHVRPMLRRISAMPSLCRRTDTHGHALLDTSRAARANILICFLSLLVEKSRSTMRWAMGDACKCIQDVDRSSARVACRTDTGTRSSRVRTLIALRCVAHGVRMFCVYVHFVDGAADSEYGNTHHAACRTPRKKPEHRNKRDRMSLSVGDCGGVEGDRVVRRSCVRRSDCVCAPAFCACMPSVRPPDGLSVPELRNEPHTHTHAHTHVKTTHRKNI